MQTKAYHHLEGLDQNEGNFLEKTFSDLQEVDVSALITELLYDESVVGALEKIVEDRDDYLDNRGKAHRNGILLWIIIGVNGVFIVGLVLCGATVWNRELSEREDTHPPAPDMMSPVLPSDVVMEHHLPTSIK